MPNRSARIALFLPDLTGGGVERNTLLLAAALRERRYGVDLVLCRLEGAMLDQVPEGVRVIGLRPGPGWRGRFHALASDPGGIPAMLRPVLLPVRGPAPLRYLADLVRYLRRERPAALLAALPHENLAAIEARRLAGVSTRIVVSEHHPTTRATLRGRKWKRRFLAPLVRRQYAMADAIVAVSNGVADELVRRYAIPRARITTIHNPIVGPALFEQAREELAHPWLVAGSPPVILGVGRLVEAKDFATLVHAFARVRAIRPARLVILGQAKEARATEERRGRLVELAVRLGVGDDVLLPGFVRNPFAYMARAAVLVLSSRWEGFGNVLVEALACGCPVVSTDCPGGPREILEGGRFGELVSVGDDSEMAEAVLRTLDRPPDRERLIARGQAFSVAAAAEAYLRALLGAG